MSFYKESVSACCIHAKKPQHNSESSWPNSWFKHAKQRKNDNHFATNMNATQIYSQSSTTIVSELKKTTHFHCHTQSIHDTNYTTRKIVSFCRNRNRRCMRHQNIITILHSSHFLRRKKTDNGDSLRRTNGWIQLAIRWGQIWYSSYKFFINFMNVLRTSFAVCRDLPQARSPI